MVSSAFDTSRDEEFQSELLSSFMQAGPETLNALRKALQDFTKSQDESNRPPPLLELPLLLPLPLLLLPPLLLLLLLLLLPPPLSSLEQDAAKTLTAASAAAPAKVRNLNRGESRITITLPVLVMGGRSLPMQGDASVSFP